MHITTNMITFNMYFILLCILSTLIQGFLGHFIPDIQRNHKSTCEQEYKFLFECNNCQPFEKNVHYFAKNGTKLTLTDLHEAYRIHIKEDLVGDICSYLTNVTVLMGNSYTYIQNLCPSYLREYTDAFLRVVSDMCSLYKDDISNVLRCGVQDNSILMTYFSCVEGVLDYIRQHRQQLNDCSIVERFRVCHCQFDQCSPIHTARLKTFFTEQKDNICYLMKYY